jgi:hypothetical protein
MMSDNINERAVAVVGQAKEIVVKDQAGLDKAAAFLVTIKRLKKEVGQSYDPVIKKAHDAHKEALAQKKKYEKPLNEAEKIVKGAMAPYVAEQDRLRREAEEKNRREQEEIERKKREEEERALQEAAKAEAEGRTQDVDNILDTAQAVIETPVAPKTTVPQKVIRDGISSRLVWKWEISDAEAIPREYLIPDEKKIGAALKAANYELSIPGVVVRQETVIAARV